MQGAATGTLVNACKRSVEPVWSRRWLPPEAGGGEEPRPPEPALPARLDRRKPIAPQHIQRPPTVRFGAIGHLHAPCSAPWIQAPSDPTSPPHTGTTERLRTLTNLSNLASVGGCVTTLPLTAASRRTRRAHEQSHPCASDLPAAGSRPTHRVERVPETAAPSRNSETRPAPRCDEWQHPHQSGRLPCR